MIIGITGKSGAGKSTISRYINNNKEDILYISVDNVVEDNIKGNIIEKVNKELKEKYNMGPYPRVEIIDSWYEEDDEHKLIYSIFKRHIVEDTRERIKHYKKTGKDIIIDWFMLEVSELMDDCNIKLLVKAPMDLRKDRVINRGNYKKGFFERNEKSHNTKNENLYDYIIDTTKDWKSKINKIFNISNPIIDSNNPKDLISVIVPVYNSEKYIERCINSITHQTYRNLEIIIVNDGSTDKTLDICKKLQYDDYRIKIINQENKGVSNARNTGIENSIGKYVAFVDSDDYIEPDMYEIMQRDIYEYNADISRARAYVYDRDGSVRHNYNDNSVINFDNKYDIIHNFVNGELSIAVWDKLFKREVIGDVRFNENVFHEDTMFVWDVIRNANTIVYNKSQFYHYKKRMEGSLTSKKFDNENFSLGIYGKDFLEEIKKNSPSNINDAILFYFNCLYFILKIYVRDFDYVKQNKEYRVKILNILKEMKSLMEILNENNLISEKNKNNINQITEKVLLYKIEDGE